MAKIVKRKRHLRIGALVNVVFALSLISYVVAVTFVRSHNYNMNIQLNNINAEIEEANKKLETLQYEISQYTDQEYLMSTSKENGGDLKLDHNRIVYIEKAEGGASAE